MPSRLSRQDPKAKGAIGVPAHDQRQCRRNLVVTDHEIVAGVRVERQARDDAGSR